MEIIKVKDLPYVRYTIEEGKAAFEKFEELDTAIYNKEHTDGVRTLISKFKDIETLDRYTVELLIDYIEVGGNKQNRIIKIYWNF